MGVDLGTVAGKVKGLVQRRKLNLCHHLLTLMLLQTDFCPWITKKV